MRKTLLALLLIGPVVIGQSASSAADGFDGVRALIQRQMTERQVPSVAVGGR